MKKDKFIIDYTFSEESIDEFKRYYSKEYGEVGYCIMIDDKMFQTENGKTVWAKKNHATSALRNSVSHFIFNQYRRDNKISYHSTEYYKIDQYVLFSTWKKQLIDQGRLKVIKV